MRASRPRVLSGAAAALAVLALTACGGAAAEQAAAPSPAAEGERTLVLYSGRDEELVGPLIEQFEQASGITVETRYGSTTEMAAQLLEEGDATPAQVFLSQDAGALGALAAQGRLAPLPAEITGAVERQFSSTDGSWVGLTGRARVVAYDSQEVPADQVPGDPQELLDPRWRGQVAIAPTNASFQAFVTALRVLQGEDAARAWLQGLIANEPQIMQGNGAILEAVNTGAADLGLINHYYWASSETDPAALRAQIAFGDPGTALALVNVTGAGVLTGAADSAEARELVEFLVGAQAQTYFATETAEYPLVAGVPGPAGVPTLEQLDGPDLDLSDLASLEQTVALLTEVGLV
ncbi:iron ABC transporter substrate-binding protein [Pseudonocardia humida]|uniref:Iron ABC transporter substrate-binding protein n=1 Tax=Pseudonocardia humida TaxID=2800819 RepID=A0ABT0ZV17_9PSEU|nr:iron ABC transporter substrate-binding protein [Pseudonocardia humida]MCO1654580.1 iron ABC transporter substrate-binding protein [Pseudonocardia humida]